MAVSQPGLPEGMRLMCSVYTVHEPFLFAVSSAETENTGEPITEDVPIVVQGIFPMLGTLADIFYSTEGGVSSKINAVKEYLRAD